MILGLTGGMGCGKSTAARLFTEHGFQLVDCDAIVKNEVLIDPKIVAQISAHFGPEVAPSGVIDRAVLSKRVFTNTSELRWLEGLVHPEVSKRWRAKVAAQPERNWVVEVPLLFENGLNKLFDFVVCVSCSREVQLARLELRGVARELAAQRIAQQLPLSQKADLSNHVLLNDGELDFLKQQVAWLASTLLGCNQHPSS